MQISDTTAFGMLQNQVLQCKYGETAFAAGDIVVSKFTQSDVWQGRTGF